MIKKNILYLLFIICLLFTGCRSEVDDLADDIFTTEKTVYRDDYHARKYDEWVITIGNIEYHIEKDNILSQEIAENLAKELHTSVKLLKDKAKTYANEDVMSINIVKSNVKTGKKLPHAYYDADLNTVYLQKDQIQDFYTLKAITELIFDIHIPWLVYGIAGEISEYEVDEKELCLYYSDIDNIGTLGLFGARFYEKSNKDVGIAIKTAISFYRYLISKYGEEIWQEFKTLNIKYDTIIEKQEWLKKIGCDTVYHLTCGEQIMNYSFYYDNEYDIIVQSSYADFYVKFYDKTDSIMNDSSNLERLLYYNLDSYSRYLELAYQEDFDEYLFDERIKCYINEKSGQHRTVTDYNTILLFDWYFEYAHAHELAHAMIEYLHPEKTIGDISRLWLGEGFATYITAILPLENSTISYRNGIKNYDFDYMRMKDMQDNDLDGTTYYEVDKAKLFEQRLWDFYCDGGAFGDQSDFDKIRYYEAYTKAYLYTHNFDINDPDTPYGVFASFVKYIIETYSWQKLVYLVSSNASIEDTLGKPFEQLIQDWKELYTD